MQIKSLLCLAGSSIILVAAQSKGANSISAPSSQSYEYIVVGSGAGGGPLAARLAQAGKRTLLIEAGDDQGENPIQQIPMLHARSTEEPNMSWDFFVKHYPDAARQSMDTKMAWQAPDGKRYVGSKEAPPTAPNAEMKGILYPRSGTLGGCTAHNALVSVYPHDADWKLIERLTGDNSWDPATMRKLFAKMEASKLATADESNGHGHGWLNVNMQNTSGSFVDIPEIIRQASQTQLARRSPQLGALSSVSNLVSVVLGAAATVAGSTGMFSTVSAVRRLSTMMGSDINSADPSRENAEGMFMIPLATKDGKRAGSRDIIMKTYMATTPDGKKQYPLDIALQTQVTKVITDGGSEPRATGVEVLVGSHLYRNSPLSKSKAVKVAKTFTAEKEVILSAGAFNTPQLLKLSGIGPKEELNQFKIPVVKDLPGVGTNLQDHMEIGVTHELGEIPTLGCTFGKTQSDPCISMWQRGMSLYSAPTNGLPLAVLKKSTVASEDPDFPTQPDLFLFGGPTRFRGYYPGYADAGYKTDQWTWVVLKAHTNNRAGTVKLRSKDPLDPPEINFNFFEAGNPQAAQHDIQAMVEGIDLGRKMSTARGNLVEKLPGPSWDNPQAVREYVKYEAWSHHASCTCPIGANDDKMAVLDSKLRVRGVKGLRVADASVFPRIPGFFVAIPTYMVGEKAADFILKGE